MLSVGDKAPSFTLKNQNDEDISLSDFQGSKLLVWFFPKASTGGCTKEGCGIRDNFKKFQKNNINVVGVSKDSVKAQSNFSTKNNFPYDLLSDTELGMIKAYKAWGKKKMYGKEYEGIIRISYLINEKGIIEKVYPKVNTSTHGEDVLESIKE
ncbi:MAG: thioredoxin-dependent thiol peroxidase [Candidatus Neomarinimicrobiota bacterium]|jgi:peroxiredoxin Q/BCP|nr:thioredoxin-dependent thiol peroxidase [Candidatus Neomarinimicrobiota bacterium]GIS42045.1 MAG: peroxiredoxin [Candidatus Neomarinimicrobiota bacterium]|tara:strand:+ start:518 stop:976 length:459 start_codon:yes stop_codon:yes gene_type:complete